ncbi:MAG: AtpZ/AtpI family protein [Thermodesulfobacteriota bacterium]|nr:AtpZ/AtpI family protein [Thermodesulfobacteriota bacterium]
MGKHKIRQSKQFEENVARKAERKLQRRRKKESPAWFGLGMFGLVGWAVAVPTLAGIALGIWIDNRWSGSVSWTLNLLIIGVLVGCFNAWYWVRKESNHE